MVAASETKLIKLKVSDFGPIAEADIELRPMSVFVGPSNTGKSYLAILIYALHQFFGAYAWTSRDRRMPGSFPPHGLPFINPISGMDLSPTEIDHLYAWAATERLRMESASRSGVSPSDSDLPAEVSNIVRRALGKVSSLSDVLKDEIVRCFGFETSENLVLYSPNGVRECTMRAVVSNELTDGEAYSYEIGVAKEVTTIAPTIPNFVPFTISDNLPSPWFSLSSNDVGVPERKQCARSPHCFCVCGIVAKRWTFGAASTLSARRSCRCDARTPGSGPGTDCGRLEDVNTACSEYASSLRSAWRFSRTVNRVGVSASVTRELQERGRLGPPAGGRFDERLCSS